MIANTDAASLQGFVHQNIEEKSSVFTDEHKGYIELSIKYEHQSVKHSVGGYVSGMAHINAIESSWALLKRGYKGTYHKMSVRHFSRYVTEFARLHNVRDLDTLTQMSVLARGLDGRRSRYTDLIADHG
ncbi:MAG: IS1595 family transposase [Alphaproteobacteria bacterium]|nr:IS1595 family transposase [Alphaproteobacteria bacterium]